MVKVSLLFRVTGIAVFIQLAMGGLVTFGYLDSGAHIAMGVIVLVLALVTLLSAARTSPRPGPLVGLAAGIVVDVVIQGGLGFAALDLGNDVVSWVHFLNALAIYGMSVAGSVLSSRTVGMGQGRPVTTPT